MTIRWHKNYKYCKKCTTTNEPYCAKGMCKKCYTRESWKNWTKRKTKGLFIKCTICGKKWQAKQPISKWYNPQFCRSCASGVNARLKKQIHQTAIEKKFGKPLEDMLGELYSKQKMTGLKIATHLGIGPDQLYRWGRESGIKFRDPLFKKGNQLFKGLIPHNRGKTLGQVLGKQKAQEVKEYNRQNMYKENQKRWKQGLYKNSRMGAGISGKRRNVDFKRSTWEANLARIFLYQKKKFQYEPEIFQLKRGDGNQILFTPDFKVGNTWWEVKGWLDSRSSEKIKLFLKQYPQKKLVLVCRPKHIPKKYRFLKNCEYLNYFQLEEKFRPLIPSWETDRVNLRTHPELFK